MLIYCRLLENLDSIIYKRKQHRKKQYVNYLYGAKLLFYVSHLLFAQLCMSCFRCNQKCPCNDFQFGPLIKYVYIIIILKNVRIFRRPRFIIHDDDHARIFSTMKMSSHQAGAASYCCRYAFQKTNIDISFFRTENGSETVAS